MCLSKLGFRCKIPSQAPCQKCSSSTTKSSPLRCTPHAPPESLQQPTRSHSKTTANRTRRVKLVSRGAASAPAVSDSRSSPRSRERSRTGTRRATPKLRNHSLPRLPHRRPRRPRRRPRPLLDHRVLPPRLPSFQKVQARHPLGHHQPRPCRTRHQSRPSHPVSCTR